MGRRAPSSLRFPSARSIIFRKAAATQDYAERRLGLRFTELGNKAVGIKKTYRYFNNM